MTRLVVVGNGMVGARFVEDLLAADAAGRFQVTVLGAEECEPYNRVLLSEVVAGRQELGALTLPTPRDERLTVHRGTAARSVDRDDRVVVATDGTRHRYDLLVLATGASARVPAVSGLGGNPGRLPTGVHCLRTIDDAREIVAATLNARRAVVLGAGLLGLEAACGLARRGVAVTVVHPAAGLMDRQLDGEASRVVEESMVRMGIAHRLGLGVQEVVVEGGRLRGARLGNGEVLAADLLVLTTGTVPETSLAAGAGLSTDRGVVVGTTLASPDDRRVFALGDCAQPPEGGTGLVAQGWEQARRLATALTLAGTAPPAGKTPPACTASPPPGDVVRLKAHGLDVVTMGVCGAAGTDDPAQRRLRLSDPARGRHVELVVSGDCLIGATCVGAPALGADLVTAYTRRTPLPADPAYLLLPALAVGTAPTAAGPADLSDDATVCRCNGVSKGQITAQHARGATTPEAVAATTRATTGCGGCTDDVCRLLAWLSSRAAAPGDVTAPCDGTETPSSRVQSGVREDRFTSVKHQLHSQETTAS